MFSYFTESTVVCCRELAFLEIEPRLGRMLAENRAALPHKNTTCGMENVIIFQEILDLSTPGSFKRVKLTFLYVLFNTVQFIYETELVVYNHKIGS